MIDFQLLVLYLLSMKFSPLVEIDSDGHLIPAICACALCILVDLGTEFRQRQYDELRRLANLCSPIAPILRSLGFPRIGDLSETNDVYNAPSRLWWIVEILQDDRLKEDQMLRSLLEERVPQICEILGIQGEIVPQIFLDRDAAVGAWFSLSLAPSVKPVRSWTICRPPKFK